MTDTSRPEVRSFPWARGYQGHFRMPGGRWQFVREPDGKTATIFPSSEAAKDAATKLIFQFMCPPIVSERVEEVTPFERNLTAAVHARHEEKRRERIALSMVFAKRGQKPTIVETRSRSRA